MPPDAEATLVRAAVLPRLQPRLQPRLRSREKRRAIPSAGVGGTRVVPPWYSCPMSRFRDFNLKLLVIEELMYGPEPLLPVYDLPARLAERGIGDPASYVLETASTRRCCRSPGPISRPWRSRPSFSPASRNCASTPGRMSSGTAPPPGTARTTCSTSARSTTSPCCPTCGRSPSWRTASWPCRTRRRSSRRAASNRLSAGNQSLPAAHRFGVRRPSGPRHRPPQRHVQAAQPRPIVGLATSLGSPLRAAMNHLVDSCRELRSNHAAHTPAKRGPPPISDASRWPAHPNRPGPSVDASDERKPGHGNVSRGPAS